MSMKSKMPIMLAIAAFLIIASVDASQRPVFAQCETVTDEAIVKEIYSKLSVEKRIAHLEDFTYLMKEQRETVINLLSVWGDELQGDRFPPFNPQRNFTSAIHQKLSAMLREHKAEIVAIIKQFELEKSVDVAKYFIKE